MTLILILSSVSSLNYGHWCFETDNIASLASKVFHTPLVFDSETVVTAILVVSVAAMKPTLFVAPVLPVFIIQKQIE